MVCKICFTPTKVMKNCQFDTFYSYCPQCEVIMLDEAMRVDGHREKHQYDQHINSLENSGYVTMFEAFLDFFWEKLTCQAPTTLDFGSGPTPVLSHLMQRRGANVDCYDKFYQPNPIFEAKTYDLITSTEVFEHLCNPLETLTCLCQHLNPKGHIALMTLFHDNSMEYFWKWWYRRDPTHITFYTPKTFEIMAKICHLDVITTDNKRVIVLQKR